MQHSVRDRVRTLKFDGEILASATSRQDDRDRWVEFRLYRTLTNQYVVARIGDSIVYHSADCFTVERNHLSPEDGMSLPAAFKPCYKCRPDRSDPDGVFPETPRYAAWVCPDPVGVVSSLTQEDTNGVEYLTNVARQLLEDASEKDPDIEDAYLIDRIA